MANWISSKLKAAESILHQIDQQAAESLRKNENQRSVYLSFQTPTKISEAVPLKDQLTKKAPENIDLIGKVTSDHNLNALNHNYNYSGGGAKDVASAYVLVSPNTKSRSGITDGDWTELLSEPSKKSSSPLGVNLHSGLSGIRNLKKDGRRQGRSGSNLPAEVRRNQKDQNHALKSLKKSEVGLESKVNGSGVDERLSSGQDSKFSDSTPRTSSFELQSDSENLERIHRRVHDRKDGNGNIVVEQKTEGMNERNTDMNRTGNGQLHLKGNLSDGIQHSTVENSTSLVQAVVDGPPKNEVYDDHKRLKNGIVGINESGVIQNKSLSKKRETSSGSDEESDSETDSASTSDSESELERVERRKKREQILAQRAAAKAIEAIQERENMVARLEGEKESLEKILEEQAKQQVQEASELQTTMMETMEAVEMEKQKHNHTRMEALARLAKLEPANADLAKALANTQRNLEIEVNRVVELRQQMELKEAANEELRRKISSMQRSGNKLVASKGVEFEREILEAEYYFISEKVGRLQEKAKTLEASIEMTQKGLENPTEVEIELKRRLNQLTDHLIQKQAQVEALSSEKATIVFRIEAVSRLLDENKSTDHLTRNDLESGIWDYSNSKMRSGRQQLGSLVRQLDSIFCATAVFLRRNSTARMWAVVYFVCLHIWVLYILMSHTTASDEARSGAVFSLENINKTGGV